jgi:putative aldouronate transport system permease protein
MMRVARKTDKGKKRPLPRRFWDVMKSDWKYWPMLMPGLAWLFLFNYLPLPGILIAFQRISLKSTNFFVNLFNPLKWAGLSNFRGYFTSPDFLITTRNTLLYNFIFIVTGLVAGVFVAIAASELWNRRATKIYQTIMILPAMLSWVIASYLLYSLLEPSFGVLNGALRALGFAPINWYAENGVWVWLLPLLNMWKGVGLGSIYYFAAIAGMDQEIYESAMLDGATRFQQIMRITVPLLRPTMIVLTVLSLGGIIRTDFGMFFVATRNQGMGALYKSLSTVDTYTYSMLMSTGGNMSIGAAVGLYQSIVGLVTIVGVNLIIRRVDRESAIF